MANSICGASGGLFRVEVVRRRNAEAGDECVKPRCMIEDGNFVGFLQRTRIANQKRCLVLSMTGEGDRTVSTERSDLESSEREIKVNEIQDDDNEATGEVVHLNSESRVEFNMRRWLAKLRIASASFLQMWPMLPIQEEFLVQPKEHKGGRFVWEGWGTSLCWWANFVGGLSTSDMEYVMDLLFDTRKGLGFNIARYNIGGGADLALDKNMRHFADMPGFRKGAFTPYDWSADERQRVVLLEAKKRGANVFEAFSNSPPPWMTVSGSVTGSRAKGRDNLNPLYFGEFADYLTDVIKQYETEWGIRFDYIAPFNEPVEGFWNIDRRKAAQEGCNFSISSIDKLIREVKRALSQKGLSTRLSGFDAWSQNTARVLQSLSVEAIAALDQINVHTYIFFVQREDDARRREVQELVCGLGKKLWMSEYGPLNWSGRELDVGLGMARHITLDINELQPSAWCYWQVLEVPGTFWGFLQTPFEYTSPFGVEVKKKYYIMMQFSRWIRPGFVIYANEGALRDCLVLAVDPGTNSTVVMVFVNSTNRNRDISIDVSGVAPGLSDGPVQAGLFRTSDTENHKSLRSVHFDSSNIILRMVAKSVTTVIVSKPMSGKE